MATTRQILFGSGNRTENEVDLVDVVALMLLPMAATFLFEVADLTVNIFGGYDVTSPIWTVSSLDISVVFLVSTFAGVWIILTNLLNEQTEQSGLEFGVIATAIALPILFEMVPAVADLVMMNDFTQVMAVLYVGAAAVWVSYVG